MGYDGSPKAEGKGKVAMASHDEKHGSRVSYALPLNNLRIIGGPELVG